MTESQRSFAVGVLVALPVLPVAWFLGASSATEPSTEGKACDCSSQIGRMSELVDALSSALNRQVSINSPVADTPAKESTSGVQAVRREPDTDIAASVSAAVRECFASYWILSVDDPEGLRTAVMKAGKTPFDDGVMELVTEARRRLAQEDQRFADEIKTLKSSYPLVAQYFQAADDGVGIPTSPDQQRAYLEEFSAFSKENNPRAADHKKARQAILLEFTNALTTK
jgi:hypothetical protein